MSYQTSFFNTISAEGEDLQRRSNRAVTQNEVVISYFRTARGRKYGYTPHELWVTAFRHTAPESSVRRAITTLTKKGYLIKTGAQRKGEYDAPNYVWRLAREGGDID